MELIESEHCFLLKDFFSSSVTAGFTKPSIPGELPLDFSALLSYIGKGADFCYMNQKHSFSISLVEKPGVYEGDGLFTKQKNLFLLVKSADCLPIFLAEENNWAGIIHMGWRSAKEGILENIPFDLSKSRAVAGVGLRSCCYQIGPELAKNPRFSLFSNKTAGNIFFDPIKFAKKELISLGLPEASFFDLSLCSFCSQDRFFSWRRDQTASRTLSFIALFAG